MGRRFNNILETVGNTPVVRINRLGPPGIDLFVKIEAFNPLGSVKNRLALGVIEAASGNTGIGLAMVCAAKGSLSTPLFADVPADMTEEEVAISRSTPRAQLPVS